MFTRFHVPVLAVVLAVTSATVLARSQFPVRSPTYPAPPPNPQSTCLHDPDESSEQAARRRDALMLARVINTVQTRHK